MKQKETINTHETSMSTNTPLEVEATKAIFHVAIRFTHEDLTPDEKSASEHFIREIVEDLKNNAGEVPACVQEIKIIRN